MRAILNRRVLLGALAGFGATSSLGRLSFAADRPFYEGKTVTVVIGSNVGGGNDLVARASLAMLGKTIPGAPRFEIKSIGGGNGLAAANLVYNIRTKDGLTLGFLGRALPTFQALHDPAVRYDSRLFEWIGSLGDDDDILTIRADAGIASLDELFKTDKPIRFGAAVKSAPLYVVPELLRRDNNAKYQVAPGAGPTAATVLQAIERGEVQGVFEKYQSLAQSHPDWIKPGGLLRILARRGNIRDLPGVPLLNDYLSDRSKRVIALSDLGWGNPCCVPGGTSSEAIDILQKAFVAAVNDPALRASAEKQNVVVNYIPPDQLRQILENTLASPPEVIGDYRKLIGLA